MKIRLKLTIIRQRHRMIRPFFMIINILFGALSQSILFFKEKKTVNFLLS